MERQKVKAQKKAEKEEKRKQYEAQHAAKKTGGEEASPEREIEDVKGCSELDISLRQN